MKFRKKPVVIDAIQYTELTAQDVAVFLNCQFPFIENGELKINTLEGVMTAKLGDWIIKGVNGEFYPCKPDIFEKTYEPV